MPKHSKQKTLWSLAKVKEWSILDKLGGTADKYIRPNVISCIRIFYLNLKNLSI